MLFIVGAALFAAGFAVGFAACWRKPQQVTTVIHHHIADDPDRVFVKLAGVIKAACTRPVEQTGTLGEAIR